MKKDYFATNVFIKTFIKMFSSRLGAGKYFTVDNFLLFFNNKVQVSVTEGNLLQG